MENMIIGISPLIALLTLCIYMLCQITIERHGVKTLLGSVIPVVAILAWMLYWIVL